MADHIDEVRLLIEKGERIEAVKVYTQLTGADFREGARVAGR